MVFRCGPPAYIGYLYDAEGHRVAKGTLPSLTCDPTNLQVTAAYFIGPDGETMTEIDGQGSWVRTEVSAAGQFLATYTPAGIHYPITDWLGTKRVTVNPNIAFNNGIEETCASFPFGDQLKCTTPIDASPKHFTGKERDAESGLDYFGARYFGSSMGRFMSPDDGSDQEARDPQSWNLYSYVRNNPLTNTDPDGHDCINTSNASSGTVSIQTTSNASDCAKGFTYVDGTINASSLTYNTSTKTLSFDTTNYADGSGTAATNVFAQAPAYGPLEGPANLAGAAMIGGWAKPISIAGGVEAAGLFALFAPEVALGIAEEGAGIGLGGVGKAGKAGQVPNLKGMTRDQVRETLKSHGFEPKGTSAGGYEKWQAPDGSKITIGPDGGIDRQPPRSNVSDNGWRVDSEGNVARPHTFPPEDIEP